MTCSHCIALAEKVADLTRQISQVETERRLARGRDLAPQLCSTLPISFQPAAILAALYRANGRILSAAFLLDEVLPRGMVEIRSDKHLHVIINRARKATSKEAIESHHGIGYRMTDLGRLMIDEVLESKARAA